MIDSSDNPHRLQKPRDKPPGTLNFSSLRAGSFAALMTLSVHGDTPDYVERNVSASPLLASSIPVQEENEETKENPRKILLRTLNELFGYVESKKREPAMTLVCKQNNCKTFGPIFDSAETTLSGSTLQGLLGTSLQEVPDADFVMLFHAHTRFATSMVTKSPKKDTVRPLPPSELDLQSLPSQIPGYSARFVGAVVDEGHNVWIYYPADAPNLNGSMLHDIHRMSQFWQLPELSSEEQQELKNLEYRKVLHSDWVQTFNEIWMGMGKLEKEQIATLLPASVERKKVLESGPVTESFLRAGLLQNQVLTLVLKDEKPVIDFLTTIRPAFRNVHERWLKEVAIPQKEFAKAYHHTYKDYALTTEQERPLLLAALQRLAIAATGKRLVLFNLDKSETQRFKTSKREEGQN